MIISIHLRLRSPAGDTRMGTGGYYRHGTARWHYGRGYRLLLYNSGVLRLRRPRCSALRRLGELVEERKLAGIQHWHYRRRGSRRGDCIWWCLAKDRREYSTSCFRSERERAAYPEATPLVPVTLAALLSRARRVAWMSAVAKGVIGGGAWCV